MGAVTPPEVESGTHLRRNGNTAKPGVNGHVGDLPLLAANGKINGQETSGKLNGNVDLENRPHNKGKTEEMISSSNAGEEVAQVPRDQNDEATGGLVPSEDVIEMAKAANGVSNGDASSLVVEGGRKSPNSDWTAPEGNSAWEVAGDESVLGPGPAQEKAADHKATGTPELQYFWMVKIPRPVDNKGKAEIRMAELRLKEKTEKRDFINAAVQMRRANRTEALDKLRAAREKAKACGDAVRSKKDEIRPLQDATKRFREAGRIARDKGRDLPATEQELDQKIAYLEYRIQHESIPLKEEKQLLRDIKNLKGCREEVCANAALHAEFTESLGERDEIQERLTPLMAELETLRNEWTAASDKLKAAEQEFEKMDAALIQIQVELAAANRARQDAFEERSRLMRVENARNDEFYQNKRDFQNVRQLAFKKDRKSVEELCNAQVERILDMWNKNDEFRANYIKSNERSTLKRLKTFDGRSLGPDEEPPLIPGDEDTIDRTEAGPSPPSNSRKGEGQSKPQGKSSESKSSSSISISDSQKDSESEIAPNPLPNGNVAPVKAAPGATSAADANKQKQVEVDLAAAAELKEKRRQQEMAKAKEAEERKKRMAERSQSKALARAQKEAEKKEKEKEKRARKKAAGGTQFSSQDASSPEETATEILQVESSPEISVQETYSESKPSSKQRKRAIAAQQKAVKPVKPQPIPSSITKKDVAVYQQTWFLILLGMVLLFGLLASMARYVL